MSGKRVVRKLPTLNEVLPQYRGLHPEDNHAEALYQSLRIVIQQVRRASSQPFYAMRDIIAFYRVPMSTVTRVYARLAAENQLILRRGSMTLLQGTKLRPHHPVRGVVAVPIWQHAYCRWTDWRMFYGSLMDALWERQLVPDFIHYSNHDMTGRRIIEVLLGHHPDYVLWFGPAAVMKQNLLLLKDGGIPVITVGIAAANLPVSQYILRWDRALARALIAWKDQGIKRLAVLARSESPLQPWLEKAIATSGLPYRLYSPKNSDMDDYIVSLPRHKETLLFSYEEAWVSDLGRWAMFPMSDLIRDNHFLALHRLGLYGEVLQEAKVDIVAHDWSVVCAKIAEDILRQKLPSPERTSVFQAHWWSQARAADFAEDF